MWIQCTFVNMSQKFKFGKWTYNLWFTSISFCSRVRSCWLLKWLIIPLNWKFTITISQQNHSAAILLFPRQHNFSENCSSAGIFWLSLFVHWKQIRNFSISIWQQVIRSSEELSAYPASPGYLLQSQNSWGFLTSAYLYTLCLNSP